MPIRVYDERSGNTFSFPDDANEQEINDFFASQPVPTAKERQPLAPVSEGISGALRMSLGDAAVSLAKGAMGVGPAAVGLLDIPTMGAFSRGLEAVTGYNPQLVQDELGRLYSPEMQAAKQEVSEQDGVLPTIGSAFQNPQTISSVVLESLPLMAGGAGIAKGLSTLPKITPITAAAAGEGAIAGGAMASQVREPGQFLTPSQSALSAAAGLGTGLIGGLGGKLNPFDVDVALAGGVKSSVPSKALVPRMAGGAAMEGLEELSQSTQEQVAQNLATGRPWNEGLDEAQAMGLLSGAVMGAGGPLISKPAPRQEKQTEKGQTIPIKDPVQTPPEGRLSDVLESPKQAEDVDALLSALLQYKAQGDAKKEAPRAPQASPEPQGVDDQTLLSEVIGDLRTQLLQKRDADLAAKQVEDTRKRAEDYERMRAGNAPLSSVLDAVAPQSAPTPSPVQTEMPAKSPQTITGSNVQTGTEMPGPPQGAGGAQPIASTKPPELMTPEEHKRNAVMPKPTFTQSESDAFSGSVHEKMIRQRLAGGEGVTSEEVEPYRGKPWADAILEWFNAPTHRESIREAISKNRPVSAAAVDAYGIKLPQGYVREGDRYVFKPSQPTPPLRGEAAVKGVEMPPATGRSRAEQQAADLADLQATIDDLRQGRRPDAPEMVRTETPNVQRPTSKEAKGEAGMAFSQKFPAELASELLALPPEQITYPMGRHRLALRKRVLEALTGQKQPTSKLGAENIHRALQQAFGKSDEQIIEGLRRISEAKGMAEARAVTPNVAGGAGTPFKAGQNVMVRKRAHLSKLHRARVAKVVDAQTVQVYFPKEKRYEILPVTQVQNTPSVAGRKVYEAQFEGMTKEERRTTKKNATEFDRIVQEFGPFYGWMNVNALLDEDGATAANRIAYQQEKRRAIEKALEVIGMPGQGNDARHKARALPNLKAWMESQQPQDAKQRKALMDAVQEGAVALNTSDLVVGQVLDIEGDAVTVTAVDPDNGDVTLSDGTRFGVQTLEDGRTIYVEAVKEPTLEQPAADPFSLAAPESTEEQKARMGDEKARMEASARRQQMLDKAAAPITGKQDATFEMFGGEVQEERSGQQGLDLGNKAPDKSTDGTPAAVVVPERIEDFGEKIGGARKDVSTKTGAIPRLPKATSNAPAWARPWQVTQIIKDSNPANVGKWSITHKTDRVFNRRSHAVYETEEAARAALPLVAVAEKHRVYRQREGDGYAIYRNITDRKRVPIKEGFATEREAMEYMARNAVEILEKKTGFGEEILALREGMSIDRKGPPRRDRDADARMFQETFGFRGVEFGNWETGVERAMVLNETYDGLLDLAEVLNIPPKAISLNGDLALAFGARGHGLQGARAHYERGKVVINITKMKGAGALAHEWMHALDHYFARQEGRATSEWETGEDGTRSLPDEGRTKGFVTSGEWYGGKDRLRPEVAEAWKRLRQVMATTEKPKQVDVDKARQWLDSKMNEVKAALDRLRADMARTREYGAKKKPATPEQLAAWDEVVERIISNQTPKVEWTRINDNSKWGTNRFTNKDFETLSDIRKAVTGRGGFNKDTGPLNGIVQDLVYYRRRLSEVEAAEKGDAGTSKVVSSFRREAIKADQGRHSDYWSEPWEMAARAFSGYIEDKLRDQSRHSKFLSVGNSESDNRHFQFFYGFKPFPEGAERRSIHAAFDNLFGTLQTRETDKGVEVFSKGQAAPTGMAPAAVANHLAQAWGVRDGGIVRVANDPEADWDGHALFDAQTGTLRRIEVNADAVATTADVDRVITHELSHIVWRDAGVREVLGQLSPKEQADIRERMDALEYDPNDTEEAGARGIETLVNTFKGRSWFGRMVGRVLAWAHKHGLRLTRRAAEAIAARALLKVRDDVARADAMEQLLRLPGAIPLAGGGVLVPPSQITVANSIVAHHGTPHKVDRFQMRYVGAGEAGRTLEQASMGDNPAGMYGWGIYFAEAKEVAEQYRRNLSYKHTRKSFLNALPADATIDDVVDLMGTGHFTAYQERVLKELQANDWLGFDYPSQAISAAYRDIDNYDPTPELKAAVEGSGNLYTVRLKVEPDQLLDWDKPLSEQSEKVRGMLQPIINGWMALKNHEDPVRRLNWKWEKEINEGTLTGQQIYNAAGRMMPKDNSEKLLSLGIRGIRYLDQGSRNMLPDAWLVTWRDGRTPTRFANEQQARDFLAENGSRGARAVQPDARPTYNYVIFDENDIEITHENGQPVTPTEAAREVDEVFSKVDRSQDSTEDDRVTGRGQLNTGVRTLPKVTDKARIAAAEKFVSQHGDDYEKAFGEVMRINDPDERNFALSELGARVAAAFYAADPSKSLPLTQLAQRIDSEYTKSETSAGQVMQGLKRANARIGEFSGFYAWFGMMRKRVEKELTPRFGEDAGTNTDKLISESGEEAVDNVADALADESDDPAIKKLQQWMNKRASVAALLRRYAKLEGINWRELFTDMPSSQKERKESLLEKIKADPKFKFLDPAAQNQLANVLNRAWEDQRQQVIRREFARKVPMPRVTEPDIQKVFNVMDELVQQHDLGLLDNIAFLNAIAPQYGLERMDGETAKKLAGLGRQIRDAKSGIPKYRLEQQVQRTLDDAKGMAWNELMQDYWYASVLLRMGTWANVLIPTGITSPLFTGAAAMDTALRGNPKDALRIVQTFIDGLGESAMVAAEFVRTGNEAILPDASRRFSEQIKDLPRENTLEVLKRRGRWLGNMAYSRRVMVALDYLFAGPARNAMTLYAALKQNDRASIDALAAASDKDATRKAMQQAKEEIGPGATAAEIAVQRRNILEREVSDEAKEQAQYLARRIAANADPTGLSGILYSSANFAFGKFGRGGFIAKAVLGSAFLRASLNTMQTAADLLPGVGLARAGIGKLAEKKVAEFGDEAGGWAGFANTSAERGIQLQLQAAGTVIYAGLLAYLLGGDDDDKKTVVMNGGWDGLTPAKRKTLRDKGELPYAFGVLNRDGTRTWVSYRNSPLMAHLASIGYLTDRKRFKEDDFSEDNIVALAVTTAFMGIKSLKDISAISSLTDLLGASAYQTDDPKTKIEQINRTLANSVGRFAGGFIPSITKEFDEMLDPTLYRDKTRASSYWLRNIPFARASGKAELNIFGEPVQMTRPPLRQYLSTSESNDPAWLALSKITAMGEFPSYVTDTATVTEGGVKRRMTSDEFYNYRKAYGRKLKDTLEANADIIDGMTKERLHEWLHDGKWQTMKKQARAEAVQ